MTGEEQYLELCKRILNEGHLETNARTDKKTLMVINADLEFDVGAKEFPLVTTRKAYWKAAIAEMLGYLMGYNNAADFRKLGTTTWDANTNQNQSWLDNPNRMGLDDMGRVYGTQLRGWRSTHDYQPLDQLSKIYNNLKQGIDDRGEIAMMWNPGEFDLGCLRPCVYSYQFSIMNGTLYMNSTQRSCDVPLGLVFNMVQVYFLLDLMAQVTGLKAGKVYHKIVNAHIYEDQIELMKEQVKRTPLPPPTFEINKSITNLPSMFNLIEAGRFDISNYFAVKDYQHLEPISYPFSV